MTRPIDADETARIEARIKQGDSDLKAALWLAIDPIDVARVRAAREARIQSFYVQFPHMPDDRRREWAERCADRVGLQYAYARGPAEAFPRLFEASTYLSDTEPHA